jgi:hypothetical protein
MAKANLYEKCFCDQNGRLTILQRPNMLIVVWLITVLLKRILDGHIVQVIDVVGFSALFLWALAELFEGVNYFRRALGLVIIFMTLYSRLVY